MRKCTSVEDARRFGLSEYVSHEPCKHGHFGLRQVSDGSCYTCKELAYRPSKYKLVSRFDRLPCKFQFEVYASQEAAAWDCINALEDSKNWRTGRVYPVVLEHHRHTLVLHAHPDDHETLKRVAETLTKARKSKNE